MVIFTFLLECLCVCACASVSVVFLHCPSVGMLLCVFVSAWPGVQIGFAAVAIHSRFGLQFLLGFQSMSAEMGFEAGIGVVQALFRLGVGWVHARCVVSLVCEDLVLGWRVELGSVKASRRHRGVLGKFLV